MQISEVNSDKAGDRKRIGKKGKSGKEETEENGRGGIKRKKRCELKT